MLMDALEKNYVSLSMIKQDRELFGNYLGGNHNKHNKKQSF